MILETLPHQDDFIFSNKRYILQSGGVGSGKTYSIVLKTLNLLISNPGIFILIGAQTFPLLRDTTMREFFALTPPELIKTYNKTNNHVVFKNGSELIFRAFDEESKLKSLNLGAVGIEEMTDVKEDIFKMLRTRLRQLNMPHVLYGATNPDTFGNWVYRNFIEKPIPDSGVIYSSSMDNIFLPGSYLEDLESFKDGNKQYYDRMVSGKWGSLEGLIYDLPMQSRISTDIKEILDNSKSVIAGLDFGFEHPTAMVVLAQSGENFTLIDEIYRRKLTSSEIIDLVKEYCHKYSIESVYCDYARPEIIEDLKRANIPAIPANKSVFDGIMYVKGLIGSGNLKVLNSCTYTIREFDSYVWDKRNQVKETPLKANDDCMDALRYAIFSDRKDSFEFMRIGPNGINKTIEQFYPGQKFFR